MSQFGNLKHIIDLETMLGYRLSLVDFSDITDDLITYSWGDKSELISWINSKDDSTRYNGSFYTISGSEKVSVDKRKKYPLIWLVTPTEGDSKGSVKEFNNVSIIVCCNTEEQWLNATRWRKHIPMLQAITNRIIDKLSGNPRIKRNDGVLIYSYLNRPKFSITEEGRVNDENATQDLWDAVFLKTELLVTDACRDEAYYEFCNN